MLHMLRITVVERGDELEFAIANRIRRALGHILAINPPLRAERRLYDVTGSGADWNLHLVVLFLHVQPKLFQLLYHSVARIKAHHASKLPAIVCDLAVWCEYL